MALEIVSVYEGSQAFTTQLALDGILAVPMTVDRATWKEMEKSGQMDGWLYRSAETLIRLYGDARFGKTLSDREVLALTSGSGRGEA